MTGQTRFGAHPESNSSDTIPPFPPFASCSTKVLEQEQTEVTEAGTVLVNETVR